MNPTETTRDTALVGGTQADEVRPSPDAPKRPRREEIVDVATRLFAERGYEGASMADLAECVGLRKASLFHHFASKDVLYAAVLDRLLGPLRDELAKALSAEGTVVERMDALTDAVTVTFWEQPFTARLLVREAMDWGPVIQNHLHTTIRDVMDAATAFIDAGQRAGAFVEGDTKQLVLSCMGLHLIPFLMPNVTRNFLGLELADRAFLDARKVAARSHARSILLRRGT